jgi:hypothetical protein
MLTIITGSSISSEIQMMMSCDVPNNIAKQLSW